MEGFWLGVRQGLKPVRGSCACSVVLVSMEACVWQATQAEEGKVGRAAL